MPVNLFDPNYYRSVNSDLRELSVSSALSHFYTGGLNQGLEFSSIVDLSFYRASNGDLAGFNNQQLFEHLSNTGIAEGRKFSKVFDLKYYRDNNSDLAGLSNEQLFTHFVSYGISEGRNASPYITDDAVPGKFKSAISITGNSVPVVFRESVGDNDQSDVYELQLESQNTSLNVVLNGMTANADLQLLNGNGNVLSSSTNSGNFNELISYNNLNSGKYYVRVYQPVGGQNTNYNLSVSTKLLSNEATTNSQSVVPVIQTTSAPSIPTPNSFLEEVVNLVNIQRSSKGLQPLVLNDKLNQVAYSHSQDMALNDYFSHTALNGSSPQVRASQAGYSYSRFGENIAAGYVTPKEVVDAWMTSEGHRANILNPNYKQIGIGYYYLSNDTGNCNYNYYWTQDFGTPA